MGSSQRQGLEDPSPTGEFGTRKGTNPAIAGGVIQLETVTPRVTRHRGLMATGNNHRLTGVAPLQRQILTPLKSLEISGQVGVERIVRTKGGLVCGRRDGWCLASCSGGAREKPVHDPDAGKSHLHILLETLDPAWREAFKMVIKRPAA